MGLDVQIEYESYIDELIERYHDLSFLKTIQFREDASISWNRENGVTYDIQVIFIGKTGYGKSTTLNSIIGNNVFETNDVTSCTKKLHSAEYKIHDNKPYYFSLCDLPGVGESSEADGKYLEWYRDILQKSNCVVYVLRADQRDFTIDEKIFSSLFKNQAEKRKVIVALNYADKAEPINRKYPFQPSEAQLNNLKERMNQVSRIFDIPPKNILYYSAGEGYNIEILVSMIKGVIQYQYR
ncbi:GTPase family protein [Robertmurraya sp. Marseille-Q9965]